jgi:hypothetical protein
MEVICDAKCEHSVKIDGCITGEGVDARICSLKCIRLERTECGLSCMMMKYKQHG